MPLSHTRPCCPSHFTAPCKPYALGFAKISILWQKQIPPKEKVRHPFKKRRTLACHRPMAMAGRWLFEDGQWISQKSVQPYGTAVTDRSWGREPAAQPPPLGPFFG